MSPLAVFKLLKEAKKIYDYRFKENELDQQMGSVRSRLDKIEEKLLQKENK